MNNHKSPINSQPIHSRLATRLGKFYWSAGLACTTVIGSILPAEAVTFNFTYAPGTTVDQMIGYEMAGQYWSNYLGNDDVTLNILIEPTNTLPTNVIGGAVPGVVQAQFGQVKAKLQQNITSANQQTAVDSMSSKKNFNTLVTIYNSLQGTQSTSINGINTINLTRADAKAVGIIKGNDPGLDGYIIVSNLGNLTKPLSWHYYSPGDTVPSGTLDYFSMALHELGHTLGFISGTDSPGWVDSLTTQTNSGDAGKKGGGIIGGPGMKYTYMLDLFRLSSQSINNNGIPDMSIGGNPTFSIDGGSTTLGLFSSGVNRSLGGNGYQGSHWMHDKNKQVLGIMDPTLGIGQRRQISDSDQIAMNVIGWELQQGDTNLINVYNQAETRLAQKMGVTVNWMNANPSNAASLLTPNWIAAPNKDQRGVLLNDMIKNSGVYKWTDNNGYWLGWSRYWQTASSDANSFWQNVEDETLDEDEPTT